MTQENGKIVRSTITVASSMRNCFGWIPTTYRYFTTPSTTTIQSFRFGPSSIKLQSTYFLLIALLNSSSRCSHYYSSHGFIFVTPTTTPPTTPSVVTSTTTTSTSSRLMSTSTIGSTNTNIQKKCNAIVKNQKVPGLKHGMDYIQLGDSDLIVSKICCTLPKKEVS